MEEGEGGGKEGREGGGRERGKREEGRENRERIGREGGGGRRKERSYILTFAICNTNSCSLSFRDRMNSGSKLFPKNRLPGSLSAFASKNFFLSLS